MAAAFFTATLAATAALYAAPTTADRGDGASRAEATRADENPHVWKPRTRSVAVFKNGLGFFMREGEVGLRDGWCAAEQVPPATFGTFALYSLDAGRMVDLVGAGPGEIIEFDGRDARDDAAARRERLAACTSLRVELSYRYHGADRTAAGKLLSVGESFVVLEGEDNNLAVPLEAVGRLQVLDLPLRIHLAEKSLSAAEDLDTPDQRPASEAASAAPERANLGMAYLRKGITWIPDYTLKIIDDDTAELTLRGTLVNEAEDLIHSDVHLVVGVPHFAHTDFLAPLAVGQMIRTISAAVGAQIAPNIVQNQMMMTNTRAALAADARRANAAATQPVADPSGNLAAALGNLPQMGGAAATDYTVYTKKDLTLRRGEKAIITLFTQRIGYRHIYRWSPPGELAHYLVLQNTSDTPWTTGPCLARSGDSPLTEELLYYTPKNGESELRVTHAINIGCEKSERETDRRLNAYAPGDGMHFDLVTLEGKLQLQNYENRSVEVLLDAAVPGKPISADHEGAIRMNSEKLKLDDREGTVHWKLHLAAGETITLLYQYERYVSYR